jgi:hypothetical protein
LSVSSLLLGKRLLSLTAEVFISGLKWALPASETHICQSRHLPWNWNLQVSDILVRKVMVGNKIKGREVV